MLSILNYITWNVSPFIYEGDHFAIGWYGTLWTLGLIGILSSGPCLIWQIFGLIAPYNRMACLSLETRFFLTNAPSFCLTANPS